MPEIRILLDFYKRLCYAYIVYKCAYLYSANVLSSKHRDIPFIRL